MKSLQELLETEGSINTTTGVATNPTPIAFTTRSFAGKPEFVVPEDHYMKIRNGRDRMARWDTHLPDPEIKAAVQKSLYKHGSVFITNAKTNLSIRLSHTKLQRQRAMNTDDSVTMAYESTETLKPSGLLQFMTEAEDGDFTVFDESQISPLMLREGEEYEFDEEDDEEYIEAYGYYMEEKGKSDDEADVFAQIVACFFDNLYTSEDDTDTIDSLFNAAVTEVKAGSELLGLNDVTIDIIHDAKDYITNSYDFITGQRTDDGYEYDIEDDSMDVDLTESHGWVRPNPDGSKAKCGGPDSILKCSVCAAEKAALTEAAALAELPTVNPEDQSKDDCEGWAIINMKGKKVIDKPKKGETMEHKANWLKDYYGAAGSQEGHEVAWVNTKTGIVTKVAADNKGAGKKK